jgi:tetratricopeptide (TPR) repeat protein
LKDFIAKVDPKRVIAQDYLYLGRAEIKNGAIENGINDIKRAIVLDSASVVAMSEIGKALYDSKKYTQAAQAYELSIKNPKRNLLDYYYLGSSYYFDYGARKAASEMLDNSLLVKADSAFSYLIQRSPSTHVAWQFRGRINRQLDDANDSKGLALSYYEKYVDIITVTKPDLAVKNAAGLIEAYTYLGSVAARKDRNNAKAKDYFDKVLVLDPNNEVVKQALKAISPGGK